MKERRTPRVSHVAANIESAAVDAREIVRKKKLMTLLLARARSDREHDNPQIDAFTVMKIRFVNNILLYLIYARRDSI